MTTVEITEAIHIHVNAIDKNLRQRRPKPRGLPSFLLRGESLGQVLPAQIATDVEGDNVRVGTIYVPGGVDGKRSFA